MLKCRKLLILVHRYLGTTLCLLFLMWFLTGIGMIYSRGMPRLTAQARLARLPVLDMDRIRLSPSEAVERAELGIDPSRARLLMVMDRSAYRFNAGGQVTLFADTGEVLDETGPAEAVTIASRFMRVAEERVHYSGLITRPDQWTLTQGRQMPLHKLAVDDTSRTELYVSSRSAEVAVLTTRASRALAWVSTIPHWLYFAALRTNNDLWWNIMVWTSGVGCVLAIIGIVLGVVQFRYRPPVRLPYSGLTKWHYAFGLFFGVLTLTWVFSGMLSLEPWRWTQHDEVLGELEEALTGGSLDVPQFPAIDAASWKALFGNRAIKEVEFARIEGDPYFVVRSSSNEAPLLGAPDGGHQPYFVSRNRDAERFVVSAKPLAIRTAAFSSGSILGRLKKAFPDVPILETESLTDYDSYYYSRDREVPLPVLRVKFGDPARTWVYIDPEVNQIVGQVQRNNRIERWLYNGLHSLDFSFWYYKRPLWDIGVILLSLGGAALSGIGVMMGFRRIVRAAKRSVISPSQARAKQPEIEQVV